MAFVARENIPSFNRSKDDVLDDTFKMFGRDIEDAIVEPVDVNDYETPVLHPYKNPKTAYISQIREKIISEHNGSGQRLSVFSKKHDAKSRKPILSQVFLALAIASAAMAFLLPAVWFASHQLGYPAMTPDDKILTGSISTAGKVVEPIKLIEDPVKPVILDMPKAKKAASEGHIVRIDRGLSAGSIIYVNPN